jgi:hypothetical protein
MTSDAGLNAYGAATWGQFFIYQGFNAHAGWMHTSSTVDVVDEFAETIVRKDGKLFYKYGTEERPGDELRPSRSPTRPPTARWPASASPSTAPTTARSCARPMASGSPSP